MLGHELLEHEYERQTIVDNIKLQSPKLLAKISQPLVEADREMVSERAVSPENHEFSTPNGSAGDLSNASIS